MADKMRVHILAKELNVPSKVIVEKCKAEGIDSVKNHMSTLSAGLHATILEWFSEGTHETAVETAKRVDLQRVRIKRPRKKAAKPKQTETDAGGVATAEAPPEAETEPPQKEAPKHGEVETAVPEVAREGAPVAVDTQAQTQPMPVAPMEAADLPPAQTAPGAEAAAAEIPPESVPGEAGVEPEPAVEALPETSKQEDMPEDTEPRHQTAQPIVPAGPQNVPTKPKLQGPRVVRYEAPEATPPRPRHGYDRPRRGADAGSPADVDFPPATDKEARPDRGYGGRKGRVAGRRATGRVADTGERKGEWRDRDLAERRERLAGVTGRRIRRRASQGGTAGAQPAPAGPKTEATVHEPVRMKDFCSATGLNFMQCFKVLRDEHNVVGNVNMVLPVETAQLLALHFGIDLTVVPSKTCLDELKDEVARRDRLHREHRPPVVTMLGHVDHGKTSLLDAIRRSRVVAGEDGGITQHIGAYHITTSHGAVTFLDTPGHEAFTAMRARGAQLTDVVVLVVAADDGIMPQTVEAINHAKAASVPIVVALNKIDLGEQNKLKIYGQLAEHGLVPSGDWGGDVDVIATSAKTGQGVQQLVDHLADLSSLLDLKADSSVPAVATVIEAETKSGVGAVVMVLVEEGLLRVGEFVVCGPAYGKVRAMVDDRGKRIQEAGPSHAVEVWGLDDVPTAGDRLYALDSLQRAKDIATETKQTRIQSARLASRKVKTLEEMVLQRGTEEVPELNVVIKADVDGSVAALRQVLGDLPSDEVRLVLRHAGVGAVNDGDVLLAAACDGIVMAFRVDASVTVRRLAEQHGVEIRTYRVIYEAVDDVKKALEGLLAPEERIETKGTAEVRQLFRLSKKIGLVAGCYVQDGVVDRNHYAKVIRDGVVVREGCRFGSLRRFKDDVKEVRAGLECGIRLEGFDDVHVGDVIESYEIVEVARTL